MCVWAVQTIELLCRYHKGIKLRAIQFQPLTDFSLYFVASISAIISYLSQNFCISKVVFSEHYQLCLYGDGGGGCTYVEL